MLEWVELRAVLTICWRQGIKRSTRSQFWMQLFSILRRNPDVFVPYMSNCGLLEHFLHYRQQVRSQVEGQLADYLAQETAHQQAEAVTLQAVSS
jgi:hypothetical protein